MRISSHSLRIEVDRYTKKDNYIPPNKRTCQVCDLHETEDEAHFVLTCSLYKDLRETMFHEVMKHCPNFDKVLSFSKEMQLMYLFFSEGPICKLVGEFCHIASERRKESIFVYDNIIVNEVPKISRYGRIVKPPVKLNI